MKRKIFNRHLINTIILILEVLIISVILLYLCYKYKIVLLVFLIIELIFIIKIIGSRTNINYKLSLVVIIKFVPILGLFYYIIYKRQKNIKYVLKYKKCAKLYNESTITNEKDIFMMLNRNYDIKVFNDIYYEVLSPNKYYKELISKIKGAKKMILIEAFIVKDGVVCDLLVEELIKKSKDIDVYFMYDDFASSKLSNKTKKKLQEANIKIKAFNKFSPRLNFRQNFRDHRKLVVIDDVVFLGGVNFSDEYINIVSPYGYWCDLQIIIKGSAVNRLIDSYFMMFNININNLKKFSYNIDYKKYYCINKYNYLNKGVIINQNPIYDENITHDLLYSVISSSQRSIKVLTPYLILDDEIIKLLKIKSLNGVDVKVIIPHIPDKRIIYYYSLIYANTLSEANCQIYEYLPGFMHSKLLISDDNRVFVGSSNLDYRSIYQNFECSVYLEGDVSDFCDYFNDVYKLSSKISYINKSQLKKFIDTILKVFSPLL